jgi:glutaredoxin 3
MKNGNKKTPILYIKRGCPWCREATSFLSQHGVKLDIRDVNESSADMDRMVEISGQTLTPTFEYNDFVVSDFSVEEFQEELEQVPEVKSELGFGEEEDWQ